MSDRSKKANKLAQLAELKRTREGGKREWKVGRCGSHVCLMYPDRNLQQEEFQIYDKLSEDQYRSLVKGRLQRDDFVVDDGVAGYTDNGMDDWAGGQDDNDADEDEEDEERAPRKSMILTSLRYVLE
jgi:DNA polymerase alpha subunit A